MCFAQNQVPYFGGYLITQKQGDQGYPYLFDLGQFDRLFTDSVYALRDRGFYQQANGFQKLGIIYHDCYPELIAQTTDALHQSGVSDAQIVTYNLGCPTTFASPSDVAQAVLKFKTSGVTNATEVAAVGDLQKLHHDRGTARVQAEVGARRRPGRRNCLRQSASEPQQHRQRHRHHAEPQRRGTHRRDDPDAGNGEVRCLAHEPRVAPDLSAAAARGNACNQLWMLKAAVENAPALAVDALGDGLRQSAAIDFSYPQGPNDFSKDGVTTGGQFWRTAQFFVDCKCWKLIEADFHPTYG